MLLKDLMDLGSSTVIETATASPPGKSAVSNPLKTLEKLIHDIRNPLGAIGTTNRLLALSISQEKLFHTIQLQEKAIKEIKELLKVAADLHFAIEPHSMTSWTKRV